MYIHIKDIPRDAEQNEILADVAYTLFQIIESMDKGKVKNVQNLEFTGQLVNIKITAYPPHLPAKMNGNPVKNIKYSQ